MKKVIRLTEEDLHNIIKESVKKALNEIGDTARGQYMLGRLQGRQMNQGRMGDARNTRDYASKQMTNKFGNRTPKNFQDFDVNQSANDYGYRDERNPQLSQDIMQQNNNRSNYEANVRNNHLKGISKFNESKEELNEIGDTSNGQYALGKLAQRQLHRDKNPNAAYKTMWKAGDNNLESNSNKSNAYRDGVRDGQKEFINK